MPLIALISSNVHLASAEHEPAACGILIQHLTTPWVPADGRWPCRLRGSRGLSAGEGDNPAPSAVNPIICPCVGTQGTREAGQEPALSPKFFLMPRTSTCDALLGSSLLSKRSDLAREGQRGDGETQTLTHIWPAVM